jgi:ABC-type transport system involved in multi-copper enzyme maturation permease subunit
VWAIARLELARVFFSKRSFWVYLLAIFPAIVFMGHGIESRIRVARWTAQATTPAAMDSVREGDTHEQVVERAGRAIVDNEYPLFRGGGFKGKGFGKRAPREPERFGRYMMYFDGRRRWDLNFEDDILQSRRGTTVIDMEEDRSVFAAVFQHFYLRLAIFFGCLGIFVNLFRGEMLDKTLHFWLLAPLRREVLLAGKYLAGLIAAVTIFGGGAVVAYVAMLWGAQDSTGVASFWSNHGWAHLFWYTASAALACVGYGSVFLASGMLLRNPMIPAVVILLWESINNILPATLQKLSVLHYVQALAPVPPPMDPGAPLLIKLLASPAEPPSTAVAILGLLAVTGVVLWITARSVRRLEINYGAD